MSNIVINLDLYTTPFARNYKTNVYRTTSFQAFPSGSSFVKVTTFSPHSLNAQVCRSLHMYTFPSQPKSNTTIIPACWFAIYSCSWKQASRLVMTAGWVSQRPSPRWPTSPTAALVATRSLLVWRRKLEGTLWRLTTTPALRKR